MNEHAWWDQVQPLLDQENRQESGDEMIHNLLDIEGVDKEPPPEATRSELDRLCIKHLRRLLHKDDPRWRLVFKMQRLKAEGILVKSELEHAIRADYLSDHQSIRRGFARYIDQVTIPQLARALANIELGNAVKSKLTNDIFLIDFYNSRYTTGSIQNNPETKVTGCHEALWQLQIFEVWNKKEDYLGRVGFNFHWENEKKIASITNIQGAKNSQERQSAFAKINHQHFGESLIFSLKDQLGEKEFTFRGVKGRPENESMYRQIFRNTGIPLYQPNRFSQKPYVPGFEEIFGIEENKLKNDGGKV